MVSSRKSRRLEKLKQRKTSVETKDSTVERVVEVKKETFKQTQGNFFLRIYENQYKKLLIIPIILLILAFVVLGMNLATTGEFMNKGVTLKGGITLTIPTNEYVDVLGLESFLVKEFPNGDMNVRELSEFGTQLGIIIEISDVSEKDLLTATKSYIGDFGEDYSLETIGPSLGDSFFRQTMIAILLAFIFMGLVVFGYFKTFVPSGAVILAAFSDIIVTLAIVDLMGMKVGTAGIAAFLMLIGYSVDTDILLSTRVLKKKEGSLMSRIYGAMRTGFTMSVTTIVAVSVALIISDSEIISQIMTILLIGLFVDLIYTWILNAGILRYYLEKKRQT
ncbi:MAG: protein translocase subunit SecF [archaeon]